MRMEIASNMKNLAWRFLMDRRAQDLVEYSLAAGFVAVAAMSFFPPSIAPAIKAIFGKISEILNSAG